MTCPHQTSMDKTGRGKCSLGLYGGTPWLGNCIACIERGENNETFAKHKPSFTVAFRKKGCKDCKPIVHTYP